MSFTALTTGEVTSGKPVATTTQSKIKANFDDHEARLEAIEANSSAGDPPITFRIGGYYNTGTGILKTTTNMSLVITGVRILVDTAGASGTVQIDIKKKRGAGAYTSIFTTLPSVVYSAGNDSISTNAVLDSGQSDFIAGDILRLDIVSGQTGGSGFLIRIDFIRS